MYSQTIWNENEKLAQQKCTLHEDRRQLSYIKSQLTADDINENHTLEKQIERTVLKCIDCVVKIAGAKYGGSPRLHAMRKYRMRTS
jgi:hypothetical protein